MKIIEVDNKQALIELAEDVIGKLRASDVDREQVEDVRAVLSIGDEIYIQFKASAVRTLSNM